MALQTSGAISLNQIHVEAGGSSGTQASINDSDIRAMIGKASGATSSFSNFYGASSDWTSTVTVASFPTANGKIQQYGYQKTTISGNTITSGSLSDTTINTFSNRQISSIMWSSTNQVIFTIFGNLSNSGWTRIKINNGSYYRSSATFTSYNSVYNRTQWSWSSTSNPFGTTVGATRTLTFIP